METKLAKTFEECCDEVAKNYLFENWNKLIEHYIQFEFYSQTNERIQEAAELFVSEKIRRAIELAREKMSNDSNSFAGFMGQQFYKYTPDEILQKLSESPKDLNEGKKIKHSSG